MTKLSYCEGRVTPAALLHQTAETIGASVRRMLEELEISCTEVRRELSNYIENDLALELRERIEAHIARCEGCRAVFDGIKNIVCLVGAEEMIELPPQFSRKLYERVRKRIVN